MPVTKIKSVWESGSLVFKDSAGNVVQRLDGTAADFSALKDGRTTLVAAKRWKAAKHGVEALQELHKAVQTHGASGCIYVALGDLSDNARRFAASHDVRLIQGADMAVLLKGMQVSAR